jgi:hypothetical protein
MLLATFPCVFSCQQEILSCQDYQWKGGDKIKQYGTLGLAKKDNRASNFDTCGVACFPRLFPLDDLASHPGKYLSDSGKLDIECILTLEPVPAVPRPNPAGMRRVSGSASMKNLWTWDTTKCLLSSESVKGQQQ